MVLVHFISNQQRGVGVLFEFRKFIPRPRSQSGQGMVEFSLILAILLGLFVGAFEIMTLFRKRTDLEAATRQGVRQASESWVTQTDDAVFEDEIAEYVHYQLERKGYNMSWMQGPDLKSGTVDDKVTVTVSAYKFDPNSSSGNETLIQNGSQKICTYGEYVNVQADMEWTFVVLPINALLSDETIDGGRLSEQLILRCWRGN